jgi:RimJ/RimL family protein N-acetyltransferase
MTHLFELLSARGYGRTSLAVQQKNAAVRFYKRLGYKIIRENYEEFIMVKQLGVDLREWTIEDAPALAAALNNKKVHDNLRDGLPFPYTTKDAEDYINFVLSAEKDTQYVRAITFNGKVIGSIGVHRKGNIHRLTAELGYYIAESHWGMGIMSEAVKQICAYVFENTDIIRIFAKPFERNVFIQCS